MLQRVTLRDRGLAEIVYRIRFHMHSDYYEADLVAIYCSARFSAWRMGVNVQGESRFVGFCDQGSDMKM